MKKTNLVTLIAVLIGLTPIVYLDVTDKDPYKVIGLAFWIPGILFIYTLITAVLFALENARAYGKAVLLSMGIILLVGFSVCSL